MRDRIEEMPTRVQFLGFITKVINVGNRCSLTMLKRSILLKKMCSCRISRGMFIGAVGMLHRSAMCAETPDFEHEQWTALSNFNR
jgi:hypothetical protein